jgi:hypothetical protein
MTTSTMRVDNEVRAHIEQQTKYGENHNDILRRILGLGDKTKNTRAGKGEITPQRAYRNPLLKLLYMSPNRELKCGDAIDKMQPLMTPLKLKDCEELQTGELRWQNAVQWVRNKLADEGFIDRDAPRGIWRLTKKGIKEAERLLENETI